MNRFSASLLALVLLTCCSSVQLEAAPVGRSVFYTIVAAPPMERPFIRTTPILDRPDRPFHFYGNTVRRIHYRNRLLPMLRR